MKRITVTLSVTGAYGLTENSSARSYSVEGATRDQYQAISAALGRTLRETLAELELTAQPN